MHKFLKLARKIRFPRPIMTYLRGRENRKKNSGPKFYKKWKNKEHKDFWYKLDRDQRRRNDLVTDACIRSKDLAESSNRNFFR